jgi:hypothetical protein
MEFAVMVIALAGATVVILRALTIDHAEWLEARRRKNGNDKNAA